MIPELLYNIYLSMNTFWLWWWEVNNEQDELARPNFPPGPVGLPVLGYLPFLGSNLHEIFTEMGHRYGPIFSLRLGRKLHVVVNSIDLVKVVARDLDQTFANRSPPLTVLTLTYGGNDIAFSNYNTHWRDMRKLLATHVMSNANLETFQRFRTHGVRRLVKEVYTKLGTKINVNEIALKTEVDVVTSILWGRSKSREGEDYSSIGDGFREVESKIVALMGAPNISDFLTVLSWFDLQGRQREMQKQVEYLDRIFENVIQERIKAKSRKMEVGDEEDGRKDLVETLLELKEQNDYPISLTITKIKALFIDIVIGATDTVMTTTEWVMAEMLNNPGVMRKVQDELMEVIYWHEHGRRISSAQIEIFGCSRQGDIQTTPSTSFNRCPDETCTVGGYTIPKGTIVYMNVWAIHRDPKYWTNPLEFKPERFLMDKWDYHGKNFKFMPFGVGRRICPGISLGEKMLMFILASLLHSFDWSLPKDEVLELSDEFGIATKKKKPLIAIPSKRLSDARLYY